MSDHPDWCQPDACTAYAIPAPTLRPAHRGPIVSVDTGKGGKLTTMLIQDHPGGQPRIVVTAAGYAQSRMVELGTAGVQQHIDNLAEQLAEMRGASVEARR